nr:ABC transporter substrate-binding protein [Bordetella sp. 15P40C-2]
MKAFYNGLTWVNDKGEVVPDLADSFEMQNAGKRWVFKLKKGVQFHDGSSLKPEDVVYSFMRHKTGPSVASQLAANIERVSADGDAAVVFDLVQPDVDFPLVVGTFHFAILKDGHNDFANPIGTGPFKVKEFKPGLRTSGERNPHYFREGLPYLDGFEIIQILDTDARVNALLAGDIHLASELRGAAIDQVKNANAAGLLVSPSRRLSAIQYLCDQAPTDNLELRTALNCLIDRKRYIDVVLKGYATIGNDHPFMPGLPYYNDQLPQRELDRERAKHHFQKSGFGSQRLELNVSDAVPFSVDVAQLMQREAARIGMNLDVRRNPTDGYWSNVSGKRPAAANTVVPRPTYGMNLNLSWRSNSPLNKSSLKSARLDELIDLAAAEADMAKRAELYGEVQRIIYDASAMTMPAFPSYVDGVSSKVKGLKPMPVGPLGGYDIGNVAWLAD